MKSDVGLQKQIFTGIVLAFLMSFPITVVPILCRCFGGRFSIQKISLS
jgi:hypothetical protein